MLPNFRVVICAVMFAVLLFAATGAGVVLPETYTRIGEMPEIGRPMMQRMITDGMAQAQYLALTLSRRTEELDRLRERTTFEVETVPAEVSQEPAILKPAVITSTESENPEPDTVVAAVAPALQPSGAMGTAQGIVPATMAASEQAQVEAANPAGAPDASPPATGVGNESEPVQVAALPPTAADTKPPEPSTSAQVKVPHLRPVAKANAAHKHTFHRLPRFARTQPVGVGVDQGLFGQPSFQSR
jgi:hypothetical protein